MHEVGNILQFLLQICFPLHSPTDIADESTGINGRNHWQCEEELLLDTPFLKHSIKHDPSLSKPIIFKRTACFRYKLTVPFNVLLIEPYFQEATLAKMKMSLLSFTEC